VGARKDRERAVIERVLAASVALIWGFVLADVGVEQADFVVLTIRIVAAFLAAMPLIASKDLRQRNQVTLGVRPPLERNKPGAGTSMPP
jgi:hypothetical protein